MSMIFSDLRAPADPPYARFASYGGFESTEARST